MLEGGQLRLSNNISLVSEYLLQSKKKWWEFSYGAPQLQEAFDKILTLHKLWFKKDALQRSCVRIIFSFLGPQE